MPETARQSVVNQIRLELGDGIVDIELDPAHYDYAIDAAIDIYRQRSGNSYQESFIFIDIITDKAEYTLPAEVQEIRSIYRRGIGGTTGGAQIDPFALAFTNNIYMIQNPGGLGNSGSGTLATFDLAMQFQSLAGRMFGRDLLWTWDLANHKLILHRKITAQENILIHCYIQRTEDQILTDVYAKPWVRSYALAKAKMMLGQGRGKFQSVSGPQGGTSLNGAELKQEAQAEMEKLIEELNNYVDQQEGYGIIIG